MHRRRVSDVTLTDVATHHEYRIEVPTSPGSKETVNVQQPNAPSSPPPPVEPVEPERKRSNKAVPALIIGVFVAVVFGIAVAVSVGDGDTENTPVAAEDPETTESPASDEPAASDEPPAASEPEPPSTTTTAPQPSIVNVGTTEWYAWEDGLEAQVTSIEQYTSEYDDTPTPDVVVTVTVKNGTGKAYDAMGSSLNLYGGPNGVQAENSGSYYGFEGTIPPEGTATANWSFTVPSEHLGQMRVEFAPGYGDDTYMNEYEPAFFVGSAA